MATLGRLYRRGRGNCSGADRNERSSATCGDDACRLRDFGASGRDDELALLGGGEPRWFVTSRQDRCKSDPTWRSWRLLGTLDAEHKRKEERRDLSLNNLTFEQFDGQ